MDFQILLATNHFLPLVLPFMSQKYFSFISYHFKILVYFLLLNNKQEPREINYFMNLNFRSHIMEFNLQLNLLFIHDLAST